jgi:probable HAF family extracellular repeat protein
MNPIFRRNTCEFIFTFTCYATLFFAPSALGSYLLDLNSKQLTLIRGSARALNDAGQVVGTAPTSTGESHAFITGPDGQGMKDLGTLGGAYSEAYGINDAGQVVGTASTATGQSHAFITGANGEGMKDLGTLGGSYSVAHGINNAGQVVGSSINSAGDWRGFITGPNGEGMRDLGTRGDGSGRAINDAGQVIGHDNQSPSGRGNSFITGPNGQDLRYVDTLGGRFSAATAMNDKGEVVGWSGYGIGYRAFITGPNGEGIKDLGTLPGGDYYVEVYGINDAGQVVGRSYPDPPFMRAFITGPNGEGITELDALRGITFVGAWGINNAGQMIVTDIPEPASYIMMLAALALIGIWERMRPRMRTDLCISIS